MTCCECYVSASSMSDDNYSFKSIVPTPRRTETMRKHGLVGVIHVSTTTVYFTIYTTPNFTELLTVSEEIELMAPLDGWFEQDATEIMSAIYQCCSEACNALPAKGYEREDVLCIGITNQRETTVMWHAETGKPLCQAIVWNDIRTAKIVDRLNIKLAPKQLELLHNLSGLRLSPYFSAVKIRWMIENVPEVRAAIKKGQCKAGTLDSWIIWNLTKGSVHVTDVTNASRTLLMNIRTLNWEPALTEIFQIDASILPKIRSCSEIVGSVQNSRASFKNVLICGVIGDQQAALVGQSCLERAQTSCTYDHGCFVLYNTGQQLVYSRRGLLTTIAYKMGPNANPVYALEGSVAVGGRVFDWLTRKLRIMSSCDEAEKFALSVKTSAGLIFVPAFTGLYAPYWCKDARGTIAGLTSLHNANHIVRAAHESICYQVFEILECIREDSGVRVYKLRASGNLSQNKTLMQLQADIAGIPLSASVRMDRASLGAAYCAAHAYSFDLTGIVENKRQLSAPYFMDFGPAINNEERKIGYDKWQRAVKRSMNWTKERPVKKGHVWLWLLVALLVLMAAIGIYYIIQIKETHKYFYKKMNSTSKAVPIAPRRHCKEGIKPFKM